MVSSLPFHPPCLLPNELRGRSSFAGRLSGPFLDSRVQRQRRALWTISSAARKLEASWGPVNESSEGFGGWSIRETEIEDKHGVPKFFFFGVGTSLAILLAALTYCSFSRKGFKLHLAAPFNIFHEKLRPMGSAKDPHKDTKPTALEVNKVSETKMDAEADMEPNVSETKNHLSEGKRIVVPVAADPIQNEALSVLKKLKIIENDVGADELCTKREYARWFVKTNFMLERNPKYRMVPKILIAAGSIFRAFDDVSVDDPDFWCIQSLAEAGIIHSKLSCMNSTSLSDMGCCHGQGNFSFFPERFVSRFDLVNWKALVEYSFTSEMNEKMSGNKVGLLDLSANSDASPQLFVDLMAGDQSIIRRVFGNIRLLQPLKPVTKAQAAVALASGRMMEAVHAELSRLEAENLSRQAEMEEIRSELLCRGEIQNFWEERLNQEQDHFIEVEKELQVVLFDLEKEKMAQDETFDNYLKDKAALDCQQQLLLSLREEVDGVYGRLATEGADIMAEQESLKKLYVGLCSKQDAICEAKSILEAEKEAIHLLRSWVEEEALRIRARAKVLEQAAQRWQYNNEFEPPQPISSESNDSQILQESNRKGS